MSYSKAGNLTFPINEYLMLSLMKKYLLGYSSLSKAHRVNNHRTSPVEESVHVSFYESSPQKMRKGICFDVSGVITKNLIDENTPK